MEEEVDEAERDDEEDEDEDDEGPSKDSLLVDIDAAYASNVDGRMPFLPVVAGLSIIGGRSYRSSSDF